VALVSSSDFLFVEATIRSPLNLLKHVALIGGAVLFGNIASAHDFYDEKCCRGWLKL
jgi:hypothetical protein